MHSSFSRTHNLHHDAFVSLADLCQLHCVATKSIRNVHRESQTAVVWCLPQSNRKSHCAILGPCGCRCCRGRRCLTSILRGFCRLDRWWQNLGSCTYLRGSFRDLRSLCGRIRRTNELLFVRSARFGRVHCIILTCSNVVCTAALPLSGSHGREWPPTDAHLLNQLLQS